MLRPYHTGTPPLVEQLVDYVCRMKLVLFDIAGTLLWTDGAGRRAIQRALVDETGTAGPSETYRFAGASFAASDVISVGDTPDDVACGRPIGARSLAVATGSYDVAALRATGAAYVFETLADTAAVLDASFASAVLSSPRSPRRMSSK